ncbi:MAG: hypothetical protein ABFS37_11150 [Acidobacteriota bacterium]
MKAPVPVKETAKPSKEPPEPGKETPKPAVKALVPVKEMAKPSKEPPEPRQKTSKPAEKAPESTRETAKPTKETPKPVKKTEKPAKKASPPPEQKGIAITDERGALTHKGTWVVEPSFSYIHSTATRVAIEGFTILPSFAVGLIGLALKLRNNLSAGAP